MPAAPAPKAKRRGSARGRRFGDPRRRETALARQREVLALELRRQGFSTPQIAARLGLSRQGAWHILDRVRRRHPPGAALVLEEATLDAWRLDRLIRAVMPKALLGRPAYIAAAMSLMAMRRDVLRALNAAIRADARPANQSRPADAHRTCGSDVEVGRPANRKYCSLEMKRETTRDITAPACGGDL